MSEKHREALVAEVKDYQLTHSSLLKLIAFDDAHTVPARPIGVSLYPTPFPRSLFQRTYDLAPVFNKLYAAISMDEDWLYDILKGTIRANDFISTLWAIHQAAKNEGFVQSHVLGLFRSDYMLHAASEQPFLSAKLKQVEFNTFSCAGGVHSNIVADMHRHLTLKGMFDTNLINMDAMPRNHTIRSFVESLANAASVYRLTNQVEHNTCILFIVQPRNFNICDERPLEYALWETGIPAYRVVFGQEVLTSCQLGERGELFFTPPGIAGAAAVEVSVAYFRAGYDAEEYDAAGQAARLMIEKSRAIKCPSITCHLATLKKVQQALAVPGAISHFLSPQETEQVESVSMALHPLDSSAEGLRARRLATDSRTAANYVLKPSLEGGGHNVYSGDIPDRMSKLSAGELEDHILMETINPPNLDGTLMSWKGLEHGPVVSELGIFGSCLWSTKSEPLTMDFAQNEVAGWSFKTKSREVDEMSVAKGYGCFDSPLLVDDEAVNGGHPSSFS